MHGRYLHHNRLFFAPLSMELKKCGSLRRLDISFNQLEELEPWLAELPSLVSLDVSNNNVKQVPAEWGQMERLEEFFIQENKVKFIPPEVCLCSGPACLCPGPSCPWWSCLGRDGVCLHGLAEYFFSSSFCACPCH